MFILLLSACLWGFSLLGGLDGFLLCSFIKVDMGMMAVLEKKKLQQLRCFFPVLESLGEKAYLAKVLESLGISW